MQEILNKRTYRSKTFDKGNGELELNTYLGHIHYKDDQGSFQPIDLTLEDKGSYWEMAKASYRLQIAKDFSAPLLMRFVNKFEGANHTITYEPKVLAWVNATDFSDYQVFRNQQAVQGVINGNVIRYTDAFGSGIHFEITLKPNGFKKEIVIDNLTDLEQPPTPNHKLVALFKYDGTGLNIKNKAGQTWDNDSYFESEDGFTLNDTIGKKLFVKPAKIVGSNIAEFQIQPIKVFWKKYNGALWQGKVLPKQFLLNATYPVRADTDTDLDEANDIAATRDTTDATYAAWRGASAGTNYYDDYYVIANTSYQTRYWGWRTFVYWDISSLGAGADVSAATAYFATYTNSEGFSTSDSYSGTYFVLSDTDITNYDENADWNNLLGTTEYANSGEIASFTNDTYYGATFGASGLAYLEAQAGGNAYFGFLAENDFVNRAPTSRKDQYFFFRGAATGGAGSLIPYMSITYTAGGGGHAQNNLALLGVS